DRPKCHHQIAEHEKFLTLHRASGVISAENSQGSFPKRGRANSIASAIGKRCRWKCKGGAATVTQCIGSRWVCIMRWRCSGRSCWLYHFRCPPGFCRQGTDQPSVWPNEFEIGLVRDRFGYGEQFLFVCGGCGGAECDAARRGTHPSSGVYVRLDQFGDRARGGALGFDGVAVCVRGSLGRANAYPNHVVI